MLEFASDNTAPAHPAVLRAMSEANQGPAPAYGDDPWTEAARDWFRQEFGTGEAFLVWNGTGANVTALRLMTRPFQAIICAEQAHINVDECGAPELLTGCKLLDLPSPDARLTPEQVRAAAKGAGNEHAVQPAVLSLTQSTEYGTAYSLDEMAALIDTAHSLGLKVHLDGARLANAAVSLNLSLRALTAEVGVDLLSFGLTKNGAAGVDAVLVFDRELAGNLKYYRKQTTQLASKMRFLAAQVLALGQDDLWRKNAAHANAMAARLAAGLSSIPGVRITQKVQANAVFAVLNPTLTARLQQRFHFYVWNEVTDEVRLMCSWATTPAEVDELIAAAASP